MQTHILKVFCLTLLLCNSFAATSNLLASTNQFRGVNWADERDNFLSGIIYVSGLSESDDYNSAPVVADRIISQFVSLVGTNSVRMPINERTVSDYWDTYCHLKNNDDRIEDRK